MHVTVTRNYGKTANDKVNELLFKLFVATSGAVTILVLLTLGLRPRIVVLIVIPVVILVTVFWRPAPRLQHQPREPVRPHLLYRYPGGRRHRSGGERLPAVAAAGTTDTDTAVDAVREVGNPTIVATFTVVAALMPMAFVSGMMGPYMRPIPILGSVAMIFSLFAAFVFTPWLAPAHAARPLTQACRRRRSAKRAMHQKLGRFYGVAASPAHREPPPRLGCS